jgi:4-amino-4-deoxy-L-arabinose transferase-like glycosyltransferase
MSRSLPTQPARWLLPVIILLAFALGALYAIYTPAWQAPDEPAHYNYVKYLATTHRFPVLKPGDYPAGYLEEIKAARFPPELPIDPLRYEFHQPPLYYLLAVPVYGVFNGNLLALRLLSVILGTMLLLVIQWTVQALAPNRPFVALGATAFAAFLPMHLAMTAAANNDILAELLLTLLLLLSIRYLKPSPNVSESRPEIQLLMLMGITTGLCFVTKSAIYVGLPLALLAISLKKLWLTGDPETGGSRPGLVTAAIIYLLPAVALGLPWWVRNIALYGQADFLGLSRHAEVVVGQLRTADFVAEHGAGQLVRDFFLTSFRSFWGQFGWMGVLLDERIYLALAIVSGLAVIGFGLFAFRIVRRRDGFPTWQWAAGAILALSGALSVAGYLWYNAQFLQHQGRYLFIALMPISLAAALGWREALRREHAWPVISLVLMGIIALALAGLLSKWLLAMLLATAIALVIRRFLPRQWDPVVQACPYLLLIVVDLSSLFFFIVPQLAA